MGWGQSQTVAGLVVASKGAVPGPVHRIWIRPTPPGIAMASLGVNIDHIANVRQARRALEPDPVTYALLAELGGADGITVHLREDRRHIQDRDVAPVLA